MPLKKANKKLMHCFWIKPCVFEALREHSVKTETSMSEIISNLVKEKLMLDCDEKKVP